MTMHSALIEHAARWLARKGCAVVITDMSHGGGETADAIGWKGWQSILIECKASVSDFRADREKMFRRMPERGMAATRYFCAPAGLIPVNELPPRWGLLELTASRLRETVAPQRFHEYCAQTEIGLLISAMRRIGHAAPRGVSVKCYTMDSLCRATLGIDPEDTWSI